jgi:DNA-binding NarL/FixJ family response regulator
MSKAVLIAEANEVFIDALADTLSDLGFAVVGKTRQAASVEDLVMQTRPDLLLFDLHLAGNGKSILTDLKHLKEKIPGLKILALVFHEANDHFAEEIKNGGFDGFWNKFDSRTALIELLSTLFP